MSVENDILADEPIWQVSDVKGEMLSSSSDCRASSAAVCGYPVLSLVGVDEDELTIPLDFSVCVENYEYWLIITTAWACVSNRLQRRNEISSWVDARCHLRDAWSQNPVSIADGRW